MYPGLFHEPADVYHASAKEYMSSHRLACIREGREWETGDKPAYKVGRWCHEYILEGMGKLLANAVIGGPINANGKSYGIETKKYESWAEKLEPFDLIPIDTWSMLVAMRDAVLDHSKCAALLEEGDAELVGRDVYCGVYCQIRCDWLTPNRQLVDLKTCRSIDTFQTDCVRYGYMHQMAFYRSMLRLVTGFWFDVFLIAVEKKQERPRVMLLNLSGEWLDQANEENERTLATIAKDTNSPYVFTGV